MLTINGEDYLFLQEVPDFYKVSLFDVYTLIKKNKTLKVYMYNYRCLLKRSDLNRYARYNVE